MLSVSERTAACCKFSKSLGLVAAISLIIACGGGGGSSSNNPSVVNTATDNPDPVISTPDTTPGGTPVTPTPVSPGEFNPLLANLLTESQISAMVDLGFVINDGTQPPNIEGIYANSPAILQASSDPADQDRIGDRFNDVLIEFSNQNNNLLTAELRFIEFVVDGDEASTLLSTQSLILGSGSLFSAFFVTDTNRAIAFSGSVSDAGIVNLQESIFSLDNGSATDSSELFGRLFIDQDGFSERQTTQVEQPLAISIFEPLYGDVTFEVSFFNVEDSLFVDRITFGPDSETTLPSGQLALNGVSDVLNVEYSCRYIEVTDQFTCAYEPEEMSVEVVLFSFDQPGRATGVFEFCTFTSELESCESDAVVDRLINDPDGGVVVTVENAPTLSLASARSSQTSSESAHNSTLPDDNNSNRAETEFLAAISGDSVVQPVSQRAGSGIANTKRTIEDSLKSLLDQ